MDARLQLRRWLGIDQDRLAWEKRFEDLENRLLLSEQQQSEKRVNPPPVKITRTWSQAKRYLEGVEP